MYVEIHCMHTASSLEYVCIMHKVIIKYWPELTLQTTAVKFRLTHTYVRNDAQHV